MRLAPRQLKRKGTPGYYGGRLTPGVITDIERDAQRRAHAAAAAAPTPVPRPPERPSDPAAALAALDELLAHGVVDAAEYADLRARIEAGD